MESSKLKIYVVYALGEVILVVIGILVAFQLESLREDYVNQKKEKKLLSQIHEEFVKNNEEFKKSKEAFQNLYQATDWIYNHIPYDDASINSDSLKHYLNVTFRTETYNPSLSTTEALINTGSFDLIKNDTLIYLLASWKDVIEDYSEEEIAANNSFNDRYVTYFINKIAFEDIINKNKEINNYEVFNSLTFKNLLFERRVLAQFAVNEGKYVQEYLDKIIRLSKEN